MKSSNGEDRDRELVNTRLAWLVQMDSQYREGVGERLISGLRLKVPAEFRTPETDIYHNAFLPLEVAVNFPELLLIPGLQDEELKRTPAHGKFVVGPGQVVERRKGEPAPSAKGSGCAGVLLMVLVLLGLSCNNSPTTTELRYAIEDRQEIHELNKRLVYRLVTDVEPQGQDAIDQMMAVYRDLDARNEDFDALFVYFYWDEYDPEKGSKTMWGRVTRAPDRQSNVTAQINPYETFPDGTSARMGGAFSEYSAKGELVRSKSTEGVRR